MGVNMRLGLGMLATAGLAIGAAGPVVAQNKASVIQPSSAWNVDFAPNKCRLARFFGEGEDRHLLFFEQYWPSDNLSLTAAGSSFKRYRSRQKTSLHFYAAQEPMRTEPFKGDVSDFGAAVIFSTVDLDQGSDFDEEEPASLPQLDVALGEKVEFVSLRQGGKAVELRSGALGEAFQVLNQCTQSLLTDWGLDAEKHLSATQLPNWTNQRQITRKIAQNYPSGAANRGEQAIVRLRVMIDESGKVTDCVINEATTTKRLESPACRPMMKAEFEPALDADGKPFKSYFATSITYQIGR